MALPATVYRANIQLSDIDRGVYETISTTVAQHPSETEERLVARLLALAIFYQPDLTFTKGLSATDEPDLWLLGPDNRPRLWVEVGLPVAERITKAARHCENVALLACGRALSVWDQQHLPKVEKVANLTVVSVEPALLSSLASQLQRSINWSITISGGSVYVTSGEGTYESAIQVKVGAL